MHYAALITTVYFALNVSAIASELELGLHMDLTWHEDKTIRTRAIRKAKEVNAMISRNSFLWHKIESNRGHRDWRVPDAVIEELLLAEIEPLFCIYGSPAWANGVPSSTSDYYLYIPTEEIKFQEWLNSYVSFVTAAANRYKGKVKKWELWNEQNEHWFWKPQANIDQYIRWFKAIQEAIKSVDSTVEIALGGLAGLSFSGPEDYNGITFLTLLYQQSIFPDIVAIHPYSHSAPDAHIPWENNFDDILLIRKVMTDYNQANKQLWVTEWGWSTTSINQQAQADWLRISLQLIEREYTYISVATYFLDYDRPPAYHHGLFTSTFLPKLAASVFDEFAATLTKVKAPRKVRFMNQNAN